MKAARCSLTSAPISGVRCANKAMIDGSIAVTVFDRIRGHARIRHRLGIPIPNVILAYEWQITRQEQSPHPYSISLLHSRHFFLLRIWYISLCIS